MYSLFTARQQAAFLHIHIIRAALTSRITPNDVADWLSRFGAKRRRNDGTDCREIWPRRWFLSPSGWFRPDSSEMREQMRKPRFNLFIFSSKFQFCPTVSRWNTCKADDVPVSLSYTLCSTLISIFWHAYKLNQLLRFMFLSNPFEFLMLGLPSVMAVFFSFFSSSNGLQEFQQRQQAQENNVACHKNKKQTKSKQPPLPPTEKHKTANQRRCHNFSHDQQSFVHCRAGPDLLAWLKTWWFTQLINLLNTTGYLILF